MTPLMQLHCQSGIRLISLDLETSGLDPLIHKPLSIGAVDVDSGEDFYVELQWESLVADPRAMEVNGLDLAVTTKDRLPAREAMERFAAWVERRCDQYCRPMALGLNVAAFDLPMLKPSWDEYVETPFPFGYRSVDLNSIFAALAAVRYRGFTNTRNRISLRAGGRLSREKPHLDALGPHHALFDAWWNVYAWQCCGEYIRAGGCPTHKGVMPMSMGS